MGYGGGWQRIRTYVLERDWRRCRECGHDGSLFRLEVHHINHVKTDHRMGNLITLCKACHQKKTGLRRRRKHGNIDWEKILTEAERLSNEK